MEQSCKKLEELLESFYIVEKKSQGELIQLNINDKITRNNLASIGIRIIPEKKTVWVGYVNRIRTNGFGKNIKSTKGLGKLLLYWAVCQALQRDYNIAFKADESKNNILFKYYNSLGFTKNTNSTNPRNYKTKPDSSVFLPKLEEAMETYKSMLKTLANASQDKPTASSTEESKGGKRKTRKNRKNRSRKNRKT